MKHKLFFLLIILLLALINPCVAQESYSIFIVQDSIRREILWNNDQVTLRKTTFYFEVHLYNQDGVYLSIASSPVYYNTPLGKNFVNPPDISPMCQAEDLYNKDKDIIIDDQYFCYWYFDDADSVHRFDDGAIKDGNHVKASMTVENIFDPKTETDIPIADYKKPIYIVAFNTVVKDGISQKIIDRKKIKLVFK